MLDGFIGYPASWRGTNRIVRVFDFPLPILRQPARKRGTLLQTPQTTTVGLDWFLLPAELHQPSPFPHPPIHFEFTRTIGRGIESLLTSGADRRNRRSIRLWKLFTFSIFDIGIFPKFRRWSNGLIRMHRVYAQKLYARTKLWKKKRNRNIVSRARLNAQFRHTEKQNTS